MCAHFDGRALFLVGPTGHKCPGPSVEIEDLRGVEAEFSLAWDHHVMPCRIDGTPFTHTTLEAVTDPSFMLFLDQKDAEDAFREAEERLLRGEG